eukprot:m.105941 g.105941  ORF g.105941 m.105941 type:complete len:372 (+) comp12665_c0_seq5:2535-3650(+)
MIYFCDLRLFIYLLLLLFNILNVYLHYNSFLLQVTMSDLKEGLTSVLESSVDADEIGRFKDEQAPVTFRTAHGDIQYIVQGTLEERTPIITYHDVGLDYHSCFQSFLSFPTIEVMMESFCFVHIHAPGQEPNAKPLPADFVYPSLDELAEQVLDVVDHLNVKRWVGMGVGTGGNILLRASLNKARAAKLRGLLLVGTNAKKMGWFEYMAYNVGVLQLPYNKVVNEQLEGMLIDHYFSNSTIMHNVDKIHSIREHLRTHVHPMNLYAFMTATMRRSDLMGRLTKEKPKAHILLISGGDSIHLSNIENLNGALDSSKTSYLKLNKCGNLVTEEKPMDVHRAFVLFLQGINLGVSAVLKMNRLFQNDFTRIDES